MGRLRVATKLAAMFVAFHRQTVNTKFSYCVVFRTSVLCPHIQFALDAS